MVCKKDPFWEHAEKIQNRFKCNYCSKEYSGGVSRIKSHLSGEDGRDIEICTEVPDDVQASAYLAIFGPNKNAKTLHDSGNVSTQNFTQVSPSLNKNMHQTTMPEMLQKMDKSSVDKLLAKTFILNNIAFNVVQTPSFIAFIKGVTELGPSYKLPSYSTLCSKLVHEARTEVESYVLNVKKSWVGSGCSLMSDIWTDLKQRAFINIVTYSPNGPVFLKSIDISSEKKTGIFLRGLISSVIDETGSDHVVQFVTDNASNFEFAGDMLLGKYPRMLKINCVAHGVQLLMKDIYEQVPWVNVVFNEAKSIVNYMYRHTIITDKMREFTKRELKKPCATRFASNFLMLQSIVDVENELRVLVASPDWRAMDYSKKEIAKKVVSVIQDSQFWTESKEVLDAHEPLIRVLRLVDGEGSTSGYIYEAMERAKESIRLRCRNNELKYSRIMKLFEEIRSKNIIHMIHAAAAFLNPSYMFRDNFREDREMKDGIGFMHKNLVLLEENIDFLRQVQQYRAKTTILFTDVAVSMLKTSHPRVWWDYCGDCLPQLQKYDVRILSQPCSSSSCERNWSAFEAAQTKKRNRLTHKMLDNLVYVRMNTKMMEKYSSLEVQDLDPINLDKLGELPEYTDHDREEEEGEEDNYSDDSDENINDEDLAWLDE